MASCAKNDDDSPKPSYETCSIVHERQSLQLCAIHTINNLLQLTDDNQEGWMCDNVRLNRPWTLATKAELDAIADELTVAENQLLVEGDISEESDKQSGSTKPSFYQKLSSQHRTVVFGRYSSEVRDNPSSLSSILMITENYTLCFPNEIR
jgi:hypothetical protein